MFVLVEEPASNFAWLELEILLCVHENLLRRFEEIENIGEQQDRGIKGYMEGLIEIMN
jgi:hypothetical protein